MVTFRGGDRLAELPEGIEGLALNARADRLWFLQAAAWVPPEHGTVLAEYVIHYEDGETVTFAIRQGIELADWWNPRPLANAEVGWTGHNPMQSPVGVYVTGWENPRPEVAITSIDVRANLAEAIVVLLGITAGREVGDAEEGMEHRLGWRFDAFADDGVAPRRGAVRLAVADGQPTAAARGVRLRHGDSLTGQVGEDGALFGGARMELRARLAVEAEPDGYFGGVFEASDYNEAGLRLMIDRPGRVVVEVFPGPGQRQTLRSRNPLALDRMHEVRVAFDGQMARLYVNGQLEALEPSAGPAAYHGMIRVGKAGGQDYNFNGRIASVDVYESER